MKIFEIFSKIESELYPAHSQHTLSRRAKPQTNQRKKERREGESNLIAEIVAAFFGEFRIGEMGLS